MKREVRDKTVGLLILLAVYVAAAGLGVGMFVVFDTVCGLNELLSVFLADVVATVLVWVVGVCVGTASVYDPYWSVQTPVIMVGLLAWRGAWNLGNSLYLAAVLLWAVRLTTNFVLGFDSIRYLDWRYRDIKARTGRLYQVVNLVGIHLFPTCVVYLASVPAIQYVLEDLDFAYQDLVGLAVMLGGTALELVADLNMARFKRTRRDRTEVIRTGLWRYSRHPNYLGEITFWFGVALVFLLNALSEWWWISGAVANLLLFLCVSIPLAERHARSYKRDYDAYRSETMMLLPIKKCCAAHNPGANTDASAVPAAGEGEPEADGSDLPV